MNRFRLPVLLTALAVLATAGCDDRPITAPEPDGAPRTAKGGQQPKEIRTSDDEYARVARAEVPGFAGFYFEDDGTPVILLKDHRQAEAAERYLGSQLAHGRRGRSTGAAPKPVFRKVTHDFADLKEWSDNLQPLLDRDDVYMLDVDEVGNRVWLGVRDAAAVRDVRNAAARLRVPPGVLHAAVVAAPGKRETLRDRTPSLKGGYQIASPEDICTLGFNAVYQGTWVFVTNSHCTWVDYGEDGATFTQPTYFAGNEIGWEVRDRGWYGCNGVFTSCRRSDSAYGQHNYNRGVSQGQIVYTALSYGAPAPSLEVVGTYDIVRRYAGSAPVGTWLDKTGRTSGSTYGQVTQSCVSIGKFRCQDVSDIWSEPGDSGSPIYVWLGSNQVELYGILWGGPEDGNPNITYSSRLGGVEQDLGTLTQLCAPGWGC